MNLVYSIVRWLNSNSSAVVTIATIVIAWASLISSRLIRLEKRREQAARLPVLTFMEEREGAGDSTYLALYIKNIGYGPALNIVRKVRANRGEGVWEEASLLLNSLGPGDEVDARSASQSGHSSVPRLDDPEFYGVIECDDILGCSYESIYKDRTLFAPKKIAKRRMPPKQAARI